MSLLDILPGIIWSAFIGLAIGNCVTNPIYRLPHGESLFARDPYCGDCNAPLKPRDLFPVFSWLSTGGKCRYCGAKVPSSYAVTEAFIGVVFVIAYLKFGFTEQYILITFGITCCVMLAMMLYIDNFFSDRTLAFCMALGALHRTMHDGSIYPFLGTSYAGILAGIIAWKFSGKPMARDFSTFPSYLKLLTLAGVWLNLPQLGGLMLLALAVFLFRRTHAWFVEWSILAGIVAFKLVL